MMLLFFSAISLVYVATTSQNSILLFITSILIVIALLIMLFGLFIVMIVSFIEARVLIKKEGSKRNNLWSLLLGVSILLWILINGMYLLGNIYNMWVALLVVIINSLGIYFLFMLAIFMLSSFIYSIYHPRLRQDYIIVLGAGLLDGEKVTPLLAKRVDRGIHLYQKQLRKKKKSVIFIMSGGQGLDEKISEAQAMKNYALSQGVLEEDIILEDRSRTTYENMKYSKCIIGDIKAHVLFCTTNYHVFRASIYAKRAGLNAQGLGARTPFYFWYNAMLREFIAILMMYKKIQIYSIGIVILIDIIIFYFIYHVEQLKAILQFLGIL
jgi:uncharacterized SAM-binding protein YcdF (DUF218 family)